MNETVVSIAKALDFIARKHTDQQRKGKRQEPYINHLAEVARLLAEATNGRDPALVMAGLLHDTIEDTDTTFDDLKEEFGPVVARVVREVTDDKSLKKQERKRLQVETVHGKSRRAKLLKVADKTSNLRSILNNPPATWSRKRKRRYFEWAAEVVAGCRGLNKNLEQAFDEVHAAGMEVLAKKPGANKKTKKKPKIAP